MSIPLSVFLTIYLIFIFFFLLFSFFNIYHAVRFGFATMFNMLTLFLYIAVSLIILSLSVIYIGTVNWKQSIELFSNPFT